MNATDTVIVGAGLAGLPMQTPPVTHPDRHDPHQSNGILLCGEFGNPTSIHWALYSGRRAAEAILSDKP